VAKGADFTGLARELVKRARGAVLIGQAADDIAAALEVAGSGHFPTVRAATLAEAVATSATMARAGDVVLLSPACASFDMFASADDRGDQFAALVRARLAGAPA
jgi:UDP-N-acetylmuramoylalanine--D-glutamate ligase